MSLTDKIKGKIGKGLVSLTALAGGIGLVGCETTPAGYAFGQYMVGKATGEVIKEVVKDNDDDSDELDCVYYDSVENGPGHLKGTLVRQNKRGYVGIKTRGGKIYYIPSENVVKVIDN